MKLNIFLTSIDTLNYQEIAQTDIGKTRRKRYKNESPNNNSKRPTQIVISIFKQNNLHILSFKVHDKYDMNYIKSLLGSS